MTVAIHVLEELRKVGVQEFCVCPGSRNAAFVNHIVENPDLFHAYYFFEERSAAFFALGRIRQSGKPVAVITTSGSAVGELLPAAMEGHYSGLPLILITADRPRRYRGSGAPQAAEQVGIFGPYVSDSIDLEDTLKDSEEVQERFSIQDYPLNRPLQINVCLDDPMFQGKDSLLETGPATFPHEDSEIPTACKDFFNKVKNPLVIVGRLQPHEREIAAQLLLKWQVPTYIEGPSGLREDPRFVSFQIHLSDRLMERALKADYPVDGVIRIGGIPTLRFWRDLDQRLSDMPVLSLTSLPFTGLGRASLIVNLMTLSLMKSNAETCENSFQFASPSARGTQSGGHRLVAVDHEVKAKVEDLLQKEPQSEPGMIAALSRALPQRARIFIGNSLPIREWDLAATTQRNQPFEVWASRGVNGIDGQVSTALGFAEEGQENWAILGDLTALYDLPGPWILSQLSKTFVNLVVVNNGGGKIFSRMFPHPEFQNRHELRFEAWATLWNLKYEKWQSVPRGFTQSTESRVIEMLPDEAATKRFWKEFQELMLFSNH